MYLGSPLDGHFSTTQARISSIPTYQDRSLRNMVSPPHHISATTNSTGLSEEDHQYQRQMALPVPQQYQHAAALGYHQARQEAALAASETAQQERRPSRYQPIQPRIQEHEIPRTLSSSPSWIMYTPEGTTQQAQTPEYYQPNPSLAPSRSSSQHSQRPSLERARTVTSDQSLPRCWEHGCNGRTFSCAENYRRHIRERSGGSRAQCPGCHHQFSRKSNLDAHIASGKCKAMQAWLAEAAAMNNAPVDSSQDYTAGLYWDGTGWSLSGPSRSQSG
jgi:hypothetical protein